MKGFSIFAPVLGVILLLIAVAVSASITKQEEQARADMYEIRGKIHLTTLPEALKWDAVSGYIVVLRNWFYSSYIHSYRSLLTAPPKEDIAKTLLSFIGTDSDADWWELGSLKYRYYTENKAKELADMMEVETDADKLIINIKKNIVKTPKLIIEIQTPRSAEKVITPIFDSDVSFAIFYPVEKIDKKIEQIDRKAKSTYFIAGFVHAGDPAVKIGGLKRNLGIKMGGTPDPYHPAMSSFYPWASHKNKAEVYADLDAVRNALGEWLKGQGAALLQIIGKEVEVKKGLPYYRLICATGTLAEVLTDGKASIACKRLERGMGYDEFHEIKDGEHTYYVKIKKVTADVEIRVGSDCAPSKSVPARTKITLDFSGKESVPSRSEIRAQRLDKGIVSGHVPVIKKEVPCGENKTCTVYDWAATFAAARSECIGACTSTSRGYLDVQRCSTICHTYTCGLAVCWYFYKSDMRREIGGVLRGSCKPGSLETEAGKLCRFFGGRVESSPDEYLEPEVSRGAALLSITYLDVGTSMYVGEAKGEVKIIGK